uniref:XRN2-binding (XTBD) domain-containing protein n=1 Tax=Steinernema glaseri TaxID=37863 RepID=A0A1I7Z3U6_9BILA
MTDSESHDWIELNRNRHESDDQWIRRRAFLREYAGSYPKNRLICLSKVYVNMKYLGCDYDSELMQQVSELAATVGGGEAHRSNAEMRKLIKASRGRAEADKSKRKRPAGGPSTSAVPAKLVHPTTAGDIKRYVQFFTNLRVQLLQTDKNADSMQMLNQACGKQRADWILSKNSDGFHTLAIDRCLVLRQKFDEEAPTLRQTICNLAVHHLLQNSRVDIRTSDGTTGFPYELLKDSVEPDTCFTDTIRHCLGKVGAFLASSTTSKKDALARLTEALDRQNLELVVDAQHVGGWNQELTFSTACGAVCLAERSVSKKDATRVNEIKLEVAGVLCEHLSENQKEISLEPADGKNVLKLQL